ncbi:MAG: nitroreductase family protein [Candidatus Aenigmarchaeota archaeon]|jgi:nitroreductase|nr:nitroreductase family protein [Candidatus Aenigmarchaeota archaeon]
MDVFEAIAKRRSIRKYQDKDVDDKLIGVLLWAAAQAPSAGNLQDWRFIVVRDKKTKELLYNAALRQDHIKEAPVLIVVCSDLEVLSLRYGKRGEIVYSLLDCGAAIENMLLAATALNLATCWVSAFDEEDVKNILRLPDFVRPVAIITVGYPAEKPEEKEVDYSRFSFLEYYGNKFEFDFKTLHELIMEKIEKLREFIVKKQK